MSKFEYKVVPAPKRGLKVRGVKGTEEQFAHALTLLLNEAAAEGWEYLRTDTLPCEERKGLTGKTTVYQNMLVFCKTLAEAQFQDEAMMPALLSATPADSGHHVAAPQVWAPEPPLQAPAIAMPEASDEAPFVPAPDPRLAARLTR
jgi:hypothetical protein